MEKLKNPLKEEDSKGLKKVVQGISILFLLLYTVIVIYDLFKFSSGDISQKKDSLNFFIMYIIVAAIIYWKVFYKKGRKSMKAMKGLCSYKELYSFLENERFEDINIKGLTGLEESKLWLKVDGAFVPKNLIVCGYDIKKMGGNTLLALVMANGKEIYYDIGVGGERYENAIKYFSKTLPEADFKNMSDFYKNEGRLRKSLEEEFNKRMSTGHTTLKNFILNKEDFSKVIKDQR